MKKPRKALLLAVTVVLIAVVAAFSYITLVLPDVGPAENIKIALTPERISRGKYLSNNVVLCMDCHSQRDWLKPIVEIAADKLGAGGADLDTSAGIPGHIYIPNITPYKLKTWTDGEILRAITTGQRKDGSAIYPLMPWPLFSKMDRKDLYAIIAYLRSLAPIKTDPYPKPQLNFTANIFVRKMPKKSHLGTSPPVSDTVKYGEYLTLVANCGLCHSRKKNGRMFGETIPGTALSAERYLRWGIRNWCRPILPQTKQLV